MNIIKSCKDCKERQVGCHNNCERYINEKEQYEKRKQEIKNFKKRNNKVINEGDFLGDSGFLKKTRWYRHGK